MSIFDAIILGILQGITEFLPISSSGHLVLMQDFLGLNVSSLQSFDIILHLATLLAIIIYFWADFKKMLGAFFGFLVGKVKMNDEYLRLDFMIVLATLPAVAVGLIFGDTIENSFREVGFVALFMFAVGLVYLLAEQIYKKSDKKTKTVTLKQAIIIGLVQSIALLPGVSRSGSTVVAGIFQGVERSSSARFSFLLGIPAIAGAGVLTSIKAVSSGEGLGVEALPLTFGFVFSFIFGLLSISFLMGFYRQNSLNVFAIYLLGIGVLMFTNL